MEHSGTLDSLAQELRDVVDKGVHVVDEQDARHGRRV